MVFIKMTLSGKSRRDSVLGFPLTISEIVAVEVAFSNNTADRVYIQVFRLEMLNLFFFQIRISFVKFEFYSNFV